MGEFLTRGGTPWTPDYLLSIDEKLCIGCGRCFKVCTRGVMELMGVNDDGELCDPFDEDEDIERKIMIVKNAGDCIGCGSCEKVCGTNAQKHGAEGLAA
ncbi:ferredoxin III, nif-specific [Novispirillum sp. DQ9]|uniref:ferredoxin III, nif-specific n=1 Tax=Novispirillum sp. DQ9 TaxID=3398612 RepID=UPI003C7AE44C